MEHQSLTGKIALVTGASGGIGAALCRTLAGQGVHLVMAARDEAKLKAFEKELHIDDALAIGCDIAQAGSVDRLFQLIQARYGKLDVLVNLAGVCYLDRLEALGLPRLQEMLQVNVVGTFLTARSAAPLMRAAGGGHIVNVSSAVTKSVPATVGGYGASKCAVEGLSQALAKELYEDGIRVHVVQPTLVDTPMRRTVLPERDREAWISPEAIAEGVVYLLTQPPSVMIEELRLLPFKRYFER